MELVVYNQRHVEPNRRQERFWNLRMIFDDGKEEDIMKRRFSGLAVILILLLCVPIMPYAAVHIHTEVIDNAVDPTCTETGLTQGSHCSECGEVFTQQKTVPAIGHQFGDWETTSKATYDRPAIQTRKCSACGLTESRY